MLRISLALALALGLALAHYTQPTQPKLVWKNIRYSIRQNIITATSLSNGRLLWKRVAPAKRFGFVDSYEDVIIGIGLLPQTYVTGQDSQGKDTYTTSDLNQVFVLDKKSGRTTWRSEVWEAHDIRRIRNFLVFSEPGSAFATSTTNMLNLDTGKMAFSTQSSPLEAQFPFIIFECFAAPVPYCTGLDTITVERFDMRSNQISKYTLRVPESRCDTAAVKKSRYTYGYMEYICDGSYLRYTWANGPEQNPSLVLNLKAPEWPISK